jgi:hypothetical protein
MDLQFSLDLGVLDRLRVQRELSRVARFFLLQLTKMGKIYQITRKNTKCQQNMANRRKIYQMGMKYTNIFLCKILQNLPKFEFLV